MAKLLIVEDESDIADFIAFHFRGLLHTVDTVSNGQDAISYLESGAYDLVILDRNIPPPDGIVVLRFIRSKFSHLRVLMLTTMSEIADKLVGFESGADDYLGKPFDMRELVARVEALLSRPALTVKKTLSFENINIDMTSLSITRDSELIYLKPQDFALLEFFFRHPNETFSPDTLLYRVWRTDSKASVEGLRVAISRIRKAIDTGEVSTPIIENVSRVGYKLRQSRPSKKQ